jgi:hypothetical protein
MLQKLSLKKDKLYRPASAVPEMKARMGMKMKTRAADSPARLKSFGRARRWRAEGLVAQVENFRRKFEAWVAICV